jgi:hypothetical protein
MGYVKLELLDNVDAVITGFAKADFDDLATNAIDAVPTWGGVEAPASTNVKVKAYISEARLHHPNPTPPSSGPDLPPKAHPILSLEIPVGHGIGMFYTTVSSNFPLVIGGCYMTASTLVLKLICAMLLPLMELLGPGPH